MSHRPPHRTIQITRLAAFFSLASLNPVTRAADSSGSLGPAAEAASAPLLAQNFDADATGKLPKGWSVSEPGVADASVQAGVEKTPSAPNVFKVAVTGDSPAKPYVLGTTFPSHDLDGAHGSLEYSFDVNVEAIETNDSEGVQFRIWSGKSGIDVATPRILRADKEWRLYNHGSSTGVDHYFGHFAFKTWHRLRFVIEPSSASAGKVFWYADGTLITTEVYSGREPSQTTSIRFLELVPVFAKDKSNTVIYIDNLRVDGGDVSKAKP